MKKYCCIIFLVLSLLHPMLSAQSADTDIGDKLGRLFSNLVKLTDDKAKIAVNDSIAVIIDSYAASDSVMEHSFTGLRYLGQIRDRNSQLKVITWNLPLMDSPGRYYCYFIHRTGKTNKVYKLTGSYSPDPVATDKEYSSTDWYGALYYDLRNIRDSDRNYWILLGIDYGNPLITRKIIDILRFTPEDNIVFGMNLFEAGKLLKYREVLEYSAEAVVSLKFMNDKTIVFDHLVPMSSQLKGQREFYAPDFSYDSYNLDKGIWQFHINIDARNKK